MRDARQIEPVGVPDDRHDQPPRGGRRDAEVHVLLDHNLAGCLVEDRVQLRGPPHRKADRPRRERQWSELDVGELGPTAQPVPQFHHGGDVDRQELGDVRRGEGAGHHGGRGRLADALHRDT